jgi:hypothetical protein
MTYILVKRKSKRRKEKDGFWEVPGFGTGPVAAFTAGRVGFVRSYRLRVFGEGIYTPILPPIFLADAAVTPASAAWCRHSGLSLCDGFLVRREFHRAMRLLVFARFYFQPCRNRPNSPGPAQFSRANPVLSGRCAQSVLRSSSLRPTAPRDLLG